MNFPPSFPHFLCPKGHGPLTRPGPESVRCSACDFEAVCEGGIWRFLAHEGAAEVSGFLGEYQRLRRDEGWGAKDSAYYRALPFRDVTGRHTEIWRIRAASYNLLRQEVLKGGERRIADLGAGNCWLSWRMAGEGHSVIAVDLSDDAEDGLGAAVAYPEIRFQRLQASFDRVPLADGELDLVLFNGSCHYSTDLHHTLGEARRLLAPGGRMVIMDSPVYLRSQSGRRMLEERQQDWQERYGSGFGTLPAEGFLTRQRLWCLGEELGLRWRFRPLPLGWRWRLAPFFALGLGRREPARFPLIVGQLYR